MSHIHADRLDEIRALLTELVARQTSPPTDPAEARALLRRCRTALADVLNDRDDLIRANTEAAEELAAWNGHL